MVLDVHIIDTKTGLRAEVSDGVEQHGLVVATRPLKTFDNFTAKFTNSIYGVDMNKSASFTGTPLKIHNGTDTIAWTATAIQGTWNFASTTIFHSGAKSIDATNSISTDVAQFSRISAIVLSGYVAITGWIYLTYWKEDKDQIVLYAWNTILGSIVGNSIDISNYINPNVLNTWQKFIIPLEDLNILGNTINAFRFQTIGNPEPEYYLDDIQLEETGGGLQYLINIEPDHWLYIHSIKFIFVDNISTILSTGTMPNLSYNKILGVNSLTTGITIRYIKDDIINTILFKNLSELLTIPNTQITSMGCDGTNTFICVELKYIEPILLRHELADSISIILSDDLSGLLQMRATLGGKVEHRLKYKNVK